MTSSDKTRPYHRRRPRRQRGGVAARRRPACPSCCTRCGRCAAPRRTRPTPLAELVCSNSFRSDDAQNNAVGLLHEEMRRAGSLILRAADAHKLPAGGALAVDRDGFSAAVQKRLARPSAGRTRPRGGRRPAAAGLGQRDRRHRPAHLAGPGRGDRRADRRGGARLLRRHRADRPSRQHRPRRSPGTSRATTRAAGRRRRRLHQLPARQARSTRPSSQALLAGDKTEFKEWEKNTPYFDGCLPIEVMAARGPRDAALRADEAGRPARSAHRQAALRRRAAAPGQCAGHAVEHGRLPDQAEARRADAPLPHDPRPASTPSSRGWAGCIATPSSTARACSTATCG